ncbi:MAG: hypothetical protein RQ875_13895, partial [Vicingaceae bacterium]|nr:hypothetical protein [Vicingaceae bacterium]
NRLPGTRFIFSDLLERYATPEQKEAGADIADVLINHDWQQFRKQKPQEQPTPEPQPDIADINQKVNLVINHAVNHDIKPQASELIPCNTENWSNDIAELENYFASIELPTQPVKLNRCSTITDCSLFIESHFATVKRNNGNRIFLPYLNRLQELKTTISQATGERINIE